MARVLITGSSAGLGAGAARQLLDDGHEVVLHARSLERARAIDDLAARAAGVVVGDLSRADEVLAVAEQANAVGGIDAVINNAGIYADASRTETLAVNVVAPYLLTALVLGPTRLVYLSSGMHRSGDPSTDVAWGGAGEAATQAYCDSKLYVTALAMAVARRWPHVLVNAVDPGWVPTRMGGPSAPDDLVLGHRTQTWLAVSDERAATTTGGYWFHQERSLPAPAALDERFQGWLLDELEGRTGVPLP